MSVRSGFLLVRKVFQKRHCQKLLSDKFMQPEMYRKINNTLLLDKRTHLCHILLINTIILYTCSVSLMDLVNLTSIYIFNFCLKIASFTALMSTALVIK